MHPSHNGRGLTQQVIDPAAVVAAMASAVDRIRRMAATVFEGDAALFRCDKKRGPREGLSPALHLCGRGDLNPHAPEGTSTSS